jgi:hypothetical protein
MPALVIESARNDFGETIDTSSRMAQSSRSEPALPRASAATYRVSPLGGVSFASHLSTATCTSTRR